MGKHVVLLLALLGLALLALALRSVSLPDVFPGDGRIVLDIHDSAYHARVAYWNFVHFPAALHFDPWMAYPVGAPVPNPFLFDWAVAGTARLFGSDASAFERTAAWVSPLLATAQVLVVFAMGRLLGGRGVGGNGLGLAAAAVFAVLPASLRRSQLGDLDHHAAVAFLGALLLWASLALVRAPGRAGRLALPTAGLALALAALALCWSGSLLYLGLSQAALLLTALVLERRELLLAQSAGALGAAALVGGVLLALPDAVHDPFATTTLSWFQVLALGVAAATGALTRVALGRWSGLPLAGRLGAGAAVGAAVSLAALAVLPALREALFSGVGFVAGADEWAAFNPEQQSIFTSPRGVRNFGLLAWALPIVVLGPALLARRREEGTLAPALCLLCWTALLAGLACFQLRFSNELAASASLSLALLAREASERLGARMPRPLARGLAGAAIALLLASGWDGLGELRRAAAHARGEAAAPERLDARASLVAFAELVRQSTPEGADPDRSGARPRYGVLAPASFGHTLHYYARRATPANNFGPYLDVEKFRAVRRFYAARDEAEAVAIAEALGTRYVMTYAHDVAHRELFAFSLHRHGRPVGGGHAERLRLVVEGPAAGMVFADLYQGSEMDEETIPYKLFELVPGALLEARGRPGTELSAELELVSNLGRRFRFSAAASADAAGVARIRVPYATSLTSALPTKALGPYRVRFGAAELDVSVREADAREGRVLRVAPRES